MAECNIRFTVSYRCEITETDLSKCLFCKETIYGKTYALTLEVDPGGDIDCGRLCESCSECVQKQNPDG